MLCCIILTATLIHLWDSLVDLFVKFINYVFTNVCRFSVASSLHVNSTRFLFLPVISTAYCQLHGALETQRPVGRGNGVEDCQLYVTHLYIYIYIYIYSDIYYVFFVSKIVCCFCQIYIIYLFI